jgi:hypothetical protein
MLPSCRPEALEARTLFAADLETFTFTDLPTAGVTAAGQEVPFGGFSSLQFEGLAKNGNLRFITNTDRGPNGANSGLVRPFLLPDFTPQIVRFELNPATRQLTITERIPLADQTGEPLSGLPNVEIPGGGEGTPYNDETPVDLFGNVLPRDPLGGDFEGIAVDPRDGSFWMVDEYRPAIYHFHKSGRLMDRFVPQGTAAAAGQPDGTFGTEALPALLGQRRGNRGFEGVAVQNGKVYAFVQSPLRNPATLPNGTLNGLRNVRVVEFDPKSGATRQFLYVMDNANLGGGTNTRPDKIGDAAALGGGQFLVVERDDDSVNSGDDPSVIEKKVYRFSLDGATDLTGLPDTFTVAGVPAPLTVDQMTPAQLAAAGVRPIAKTLHVDLNAAGYNGVEKVEGLAVLGPDTIAVINDNDFTVGDIAIDNATGTFTRNRAGDAIVLGVIRTDAPAPGTGGVLVNGLKKGQRGDADDIAAAIASLFQ